MRVVTLVQNFAQDIRQGLRTMWRQPGLSIAAIITLALGIGANAAIFTLTNAVMFKMLPVRQPERLMHFAFKNPIFGHDDGFSCPALEEFRAENQVYDGILAFSTPRKINVELNGRGELAEGQYVSGNYFPLLGVTPVMGTTFTEQSDKVPGANPVAVISYGYWQKRFGSDRAIVGKKVSLNGYPFTIIGVTPLEFFGLEPGKQIEISVPISMVAQVQPSFAMAGQQNDILKSWARGWLYLSARLKDGVGRETAQANSGPIYQRTQEKWVEFVAASPDTTYEFRQSLLNSKFILEEGGRGLESLRQQFSKPLLILMVTVLLLLLIACGNVAHLLLVRATARQREIAVRVALGAKRQRVIQQMLTESFLFAVAGAILGYFLAVWVDGLLAGMILNSSYAIALNIKPDMTVLGFNAVICLVATLLFGFAPALQMTRFEVGPVLKESSNASPQGTKQGLKLGKILVISQVALSLVLLIGAGLFSRSFQNLRSTNPGLEKQNVLLMSVNPSLIGYKGPQLTQLCRELSERIAGLSGVRSVSMSVFPPVTKDVISTRLYVLGYTPRQGENTMVKINYVGPDYFKTLGVPVVAGREFTAADNESASKVAMISEALARQFFGSGNATGRRLGFAGPGNAGSLEVLGVVQDMKYRSLREAAQPVVYVPILQSDVSGAPLTFEISTKVPPNNMVTDIRLLIHERDALIPVFGVETLAEHINGSLIEETLIAYLSSLFGVLALVLVTVGLYGLMAYAVTRRTREIGLRMAMGAQRGNVIWHVMRETLVLVAIGLVIGLPIALGISSVASSELYGLKSTDPLTIAAMILLMLTVAILAGYFPARRASKLDPMEALRCE